MPHKDPVARAAYLQQWTEKNKERLRINKKLYREKNADKLKENWHKWYANNRENVSAYSKKYREDNAEKKKANGRAYYLANKESHDEYGKRYYAENRESMLIKNRERWAAKGEQYRAKSSEWRKNNPDKKAAASRNWRSYKKSASGKHTAADIKRIWDRQKHKCAVPGCTSPVAASGKNKYHVDHIQPLSRGGSNWPDNLQCLCWMCNLKKGDKYPEEWAQQTLGRLFA